MSNNVNSFPPEWNEYDVNKFVNGDGYDEISDGNITEIDGKKVLTPLGAYRVTKHEDVTTLIDNENITFNRAANYNFMVSNHQGVILDPSHIYTFVIDGTRFENLIPFEGGSLLDEPYEIGASYSAPSMDFSEYPFGVSSYAIIIPYSEPNHQPHVITLIDESVGSEVTITQPMDKSLFFDFGIKATIIDDLSTYELIHGSYENIKNALINGKLVTGYMRVDDEYGVLYSYINAISHDYDSDSIRVVFNDGVLFILEDNTVTESDLS